MTVKKQRTEKRVGEVLDLVRTGQMTPHKGKQELQKAAATDKDLHDKLQPVIEAWEVVQDYLKRAVVSKLTEHAFDSESEKTSIAALRELTKMLGIGDTRSRSGESGPVIHITTDSLQVIEAVERRGEDDG